MINHKRSRSDQEEIRLKDRRRKLTDKKANEIKKLLRYSPKIERAKNCPKCGPAMFLGLHKDRLYCGSCHYSEFLKK